jgi:hypothetical protein
MRPGRLVRLLVSTCAFDLPPHNRAQLPGQSPNPPRRQVFVYFCQECLQVVDVLTRRAPAANRPVCPRDRAHKCVGKQTKSCLECRSMLVFERATVSVRGVSCRRGRHSPRPLFQGDANAATPADFRRA